MIYLAFALAGLGFAVLVGVYRRYLGRGGPGEPGPPDGSDFRLW